MNKKILPAFLFCTFLGGLGVHRFYVGKNGTAVVQLLCTLSIVGVFVTMVWAFIDWIIILAGAFTDKEGNKITEWV
jgi:TM2 domain-containing membrane protein YozV